jgi:toluene monooxygenase system ferredoxin subunit
MEVGVMNFPSGHLFDGLDKAQIKKLEGIAKIMHVEKGQSIFKEGDEAKAVYVLEEGAVELTTFVEKDFELPISILRNRGDMFGSSALLAPHVYSLSARCAEKGKILRFESNTLKQIMSEDHSLGCRIMSNLASYFFARLKETRQELKIHFKTLLMSTRS